MAPPPLRRQIAKDRFSVLFGGLKTQPYVDPVVRPSLSYMYALHPRCADVAADQFSAATVQFPGTRLDH